MEVAICGVMIDVWKPNECLIYEPLMKFPQKCRAEMRAATEQIALPRHREVFPPYHHNMNHLEQISIVYLDIDCPETMQAVKVSIL